MALSILINGLVLGGVYALLAIGFSIIFGVAKILNMSHTAFYMIGAFLIYIAVKILLVPALPAFILTIPIVGLLGGICYKLFFDRIKRHGTSVMIISVALAILFQETLMIIFGGNYRGIDPYFPGFLDIAGVRVTNQSIFAIIANIVMIAGVWFLLQKTMLGNVIRAVADDAEVTNLMGINVSRICLIVMIVSTALAGTAAVVVAPIITIDPLMWMHPLVIVMAAVVLGGLGSIKGSIMGAFILAFAEVCVVFLIPKASFLKEAVSLSAMILVLLFKPEGLFGAVFEEERL